MAFVRLLLISIVAPVLACAAIILVLAGSLDSSIIIPLIFAWPGSLLLLLPVYAGLARLRVEMGLRYASVLLVGLVGGAVILGAFAGGRMDGFTWGGSFGAATAVAWVILHAASRRVWRPARR